MQVHILMLKSCIYPELQKNDAIIDCPNAATPTPRTAAPPEPARYYGFLMQVRRAHSRELESRSDSPFEWFGHPAAPPLLMGNCFLDTACFSQSFRRLKNKLFDGDAAIFRSGKFISLLDEIRNHSAIEAQLVHAFY